MSLRQLRFCVVGRGKCYNSGTCRPGDYSIFFCLYLNFSSNSTEYHLKFYQQFNTVAAASDQSHLYMIFFFYNQFHIMCTVYSFTPYNSQCKMNSGVGVWLILGKKKEKLFSIFY